MLPGRASARLLERGAGLAGDGRLPAGGGQVLDRLRRVPEIEKGEPASVEALAVDLGHLVHQQELRESLDGLLQQRLLAGAVADQLGTLVPHPREVVGRHQRQYLGVAPARTPVELFQIAVALHHVVPHAVESSLEGCAEGGEVGGESGPDGAGPLPIAMLEELVEGLAPLLETRELSAIGVAALRAREPGRSSRGEQRRERNPPDEAPARHSEARAKPVAPASFASPSTRTTSPRITSRSPASTTTLSGARSSASRSTLARVASSPPTRRSFT